MNLLDTNQDDQIQIDESVDYLTELTKSGGKFDRSKYESDQDMYKAIAKSNFHGDKYIDHFKGIHDNLREDYKRLKSEYDAGPSLKELIDQFKSTQGSNNDNTQIVNEDKSATLDPTKIEELIRNQIQQTKLMDKEEQNYNQVQAKLIEAYGPNYANTLKQQISQLGLTADFVNDLARKHPNVLFKTLGLDGQRQAETFQAPFKSTNQSDNFGSNTPKRTWSYYEKIRKTDQQRYYDPKTQDQMFKDANSLGDAFNDGDFHKVYT